MQFPFLITLLITALAAPVHAQVHAPNAEWVALAQSENMRNDQRACAYSEFLQSYLRSLSDEEIRKSIANSAQSYQDFVDSDESILTPAEQKVRERMLRDYQALAEDPAPRENMARTYESLCKVGRVTGGAVLKSAVYSASALTSAVTLPIRFVAKFGIGVFSRKPQKTRGASYGEISGSSGLENFADVAYQAVRVSFFSGNPLLLGVYGIAAIDMSAQEFCKSNQPKTDRELTFCKRYSDLKTTEFKATQVGSKGGAAVGKFLLHTLDFRSDESADEDLCDKSFKKQLRVGKRARERLLDRLQKNGFTDAQVLVNPPEIHGCVSLKILNLDGKQLEALKTESGFQDGIPYTLELKNAVPATATPAPTPDYTKDEDLCKAAYSANVYDYVSRGQSWEAKGQLIQVAVSPSRFAKPAIEEIQMPSEWMRSENASQLENGKNVILIMAPTQQQQDEYDAILPHLKDMQEQLKSEYKKFKWLKKSSSYEECLDRQAEIQFDYPAYQALKESVGKITVAQRIEEYRAMSKQVAKAGHSFLGLGHSLKLDWETKNMDTLNVLFETLNDPELENLVIVTHGEENGTIVDSRLNELPSSAFDTVHPKLQSISFFSCHSIAAQKKYSLKENLLKNESYSEIRSVNHVISSDFMEKNNQAPVMGLGDYLKSLDEVLARSSTGNRRTQMAFGNQMQPAKPANECSIEFNGLVVSKGAFNLKINSHWAGIYESGQAISPHTIPCDWLGDQNQLILENPSLVEKSSLQSAKVSITITGKNFRKDFVEASPKVRADGSISRLNWTK